MVTLDDDLLTAAAAGDAAAIRDALERGADVDARGPGRASALLLAARSGNDDAVRALIEAGADVDAQDDASLNPFLLGCITNRVGLVRLMVAAGCDLERRTRFGGNGLTPASEKGHVDVVRHLVEETPINVNHTNNLGWTALIEAIILGDGGAAHQEVVELLLTHGADPTMVDPYGVPPLELARQKGYTEIVAILERFLS